MRKFPLCRPVFALLSTFLMFPPKLAGQTTSPTPPTSDPQAIALAANGVDEPDSDGGSGGGDCTMDGAVDQSCSMDGSEGGVQCPDNSCTGVGTDANGNQYIVQFYAFAGGLSGYFNPSDLAQNIWEWNGQLKTAAGWQQLTQPYSNYMQGMLASILGVNPSALTPTGLTGGNADFTISQQVGNNYIQDPDSGCSAGAFGTRCDDPDLHFTQMYDNSGNPNGYSLHMDSGDLYSLPFGPIVHGFIDVILGNTIFQTGVPH
jgi:hypothetical protein